MKSLRDVLKLLAVRLRSVRNGFRAMGRLDLLKAFFLALLGAMFVAAEFWFFNRLFTELRDQELLSHFFVQVLIERLLGMVFLTALSMMLFSSVVSAISSLFLSADLDLLLSSPVSNVSVFITKQIETTFNSSYMVVVFTAPILFAYGWCFDAGIGFYFASAMVLILFIVPPCTLGVGITLLLVRFFPAKRAQQVLVLGGLTAAVTLIMLARLLQPEKLLNPDSTDDLMKLLDGMTIPALDFLPSTWATRSLLAVMTGNSAAALRYWAGLLGLGVVLLLALAAWARISYVAALSRSVETRTTFSRKKPGLARVETPGPVGPRRWLFGLIAKDLRTFLRDSSQWSQLFLLGALVVIYLFNIKILPKDQLFLTERLSLADFVSWLNMGLAGVVLAALALRFVYPSISLEGRAMWILKASPNRFTPVLWAKFIVHAVPLVVLAQVLVVSSNLLLGADAYIHTLSVFFVLAMTITLTGMAAGLGAMKPYFRSLNSAQIAVSSGGLLFMILGLVYVVVMMAATFRPVQLHFLERWTGQPADPWTLIAFYAVMALVSAAGTLVPMVLGARSLESMEI